MKKIKLFPAPHMEVRVFVSDEMEKDFVECKHAMKRRKLMDCNECSWKGANFYGISICMLDDVEEKMEGMLNETNRKER